MWARSTNIETVVPVAGSKLNLLAQFETDYGANLIGATVTRVRGLITASPNVSTAASNLVVAARVSNDAELAAGSGPIDQPHLDWSMWEPFIFRFGGITQVDANRTFDFSRVVDVKSQRKVEEVNEEFAIWLQPTGQAWTVSWQLSILLKLP